MGKARREREARRAEVTSYYFVPAMANFHEIGAARERTKRLAMQQAGDRARSGVMWNQWPASEVMAILPAMFPNPNDDEQKIIDSCQKFASAFPDSQLVVAEILIAEPPGTTPGHKITADEPTREFADFVRRGPQ